MDNQSCSACVNIDTPSSKEPCKSCFEDGNTHPNYTPIKDPTNPDHYKSETSLECIEAMEMIFGVQAVYDFCICNAWKYIWRWRNKNGAEDLDKATWYIDRAVMYFPGDDLEHYDLKLIERMQKYIDNNREQSTSIGG